MIKARVVNKMGLDEFAIKVYSSFVQMAGHRRVLSKVDNENPIKVVRDEVKRQSGVEMINESPPAYESQSNGAIENMNQRIQGQFRTLRDALETRIG